MTTRDPAFVTDEHRLLRDQARRGKLPFVQLGHYVRFRGEDLDGYVAEHRRA